MKNTVKKKHGIVIFFGIILVFLVLTAVIIVIGFRPIQNKFITEKIVELITNSGVDSCSADRVIVTPWKKIEFEGLNIKADIGDDRHLDITIAYGQLQYSITSLLLHPGDLVQIFSNHKGNSKDTQIPPVNISTIMKYTAPFYAIHCRGNRLQIVQKQNNILNLSNYRVDINKKSDLGSVYEGKVEFDSAIIDKWPVTKVKADLTCDNQSVKIKNSSGKFLDGDFTIDGDIKVKSSKIESLRCVARGLSIDKYYSIEKTYLGKIRGMADLNLTLGESMFNTDSLNGKGTLFASNVTVVNLPVQKALVSLLGFPQLGQVKFDTVRADFELKSGNNFSNSISGKGPIIGFSSIGWIKNDGKLNQNIDGVLTRAFIETLPGIVSESLQKSADNGRKFQCRIYGSLDHPRMELSKETLKKAFSGTFDSMKHSIEEIFK